MKKLITILLTLAMITALFVLPSSALTEADVAGWKYTLLMQENNGFCFTGDDVLLYGKYCMRGMAVSQDGKYLFGGFLNPNGNGSIEMFDATNGKVVSGIQYIQPENSKSAYPKGLATDDRGYVYAALAYNPNDTFAHIAVYEYSTGELKQVSYTEIIKTDADTKTGVNGITIEKINGNYYAYIVVNYKVDYLIRVNVTDPANPILDTSFGTEGRINLLDEKYGSANADDFDACYLDVDTDGTIYLAAGDKKDGAKVKKVFVLSADGSAVLNTLDTGSDTAYGVALWDNYLFVTFQNTGKFSIYDKTTLAPVANAEITAENVVLPFDRDNTLIATGLNSLCNVTVINDILFLGDQGANQSGLDQIFAIGLTADAAKTLESYAQGIYARLDSIYPEATEAPDTTEAPVTDAPNTTEVATEEDPTTDAPVNTENTDAPVQTDAPAATDPAPSKGCGGMIAGSAVILALIATAVVIKKRD